MCALHWLRWQSWLQYLAVLHRPHLRVPGSEQEGLEQGSAMLEIQNFLDGGCVTDSERVLKFKSIWCEGDDGESVDFRYSRKRPCYSYNTTNMQMQSKIETL